MSYPLTEIHITDEHGTDYTDLFADIDLDEFDLIGTTSISSIDVTIFNSPVSPRASADGPLGSLLERWIGSHSKRDESTYGWQYLDAPDVHTISWEDNGQVNFVNVFGHSAEGRRAYRLKAITAALGLIVDFTLA